MTKFGKLLAKTGAVNTKTTRVRLLHPFGLITFIIMMIAVLIICPFTEAKIQDVLEEACFWGES